MQNWTPLLAILKKEYLLLIRDIHGLLLLFLMPAVFIVIMSLAMQQNFSAHRDTQLKVWVNDQALSDESARLLAELEKTGVFELTHYTEQPIEALQPAIVQDAAALLITIYELDEEDDAGNLLGARVLVAPATSKQMEAIILATLRDCLRAIKVEPLLAELNSQDLGEALSLDMIATVELQVNYAFDQSSEMPPTAVQQNVPAWLVFAMFFVVVPLSNTLIRERQLGTLRRLRTFNLSPGILILGKLVPYFVLMQLQVILMLLVGRFLVPLLGGDQFIIGDSLFPLALMAVSISIAALGYASLIAVAATTTEQATTLGGAGNIILAALGGIMVPTFVMPVAMQKISKLSPMNWGLEGFLDVFLRQGDWLMIWPKVVSLWALGAILLAMACWLLAKRQDV